MKLALHYFGALLLSAILLSLLTWHFTPKNVPAKFQLPQFNKTFVSSYGDRDAIHRIIYQGLFHFGKRMQAADALIIGNSHAELGLSAEQISQRLSQQYGRDYKVMNLAVGWGESFQFDKFLIEKNNLRDKLLVMDLYVTAQSTLSAVGAPVINESKLTAYCKVIDAWFVVLKDWTLDGIYPRITFYREANQFTFKRFLTYPVGFRKWKNGDVEDYWFPTMGAIYHQTPRSLVTYPDKFVGTKVRSVTEARDIIDPEFLKRRNFKLVTTLIPSNELDQQFYVAPFVGLGLNYLPISMSGIELYDSIHADAKGRYDITSRLLTHLESKTIMLAAKQ